MNYYSRSFPSTKITGILNLLKYWEKNFTGILESIRVTERNWNSRFTDSLLKEKIST